MNKLLNRNWHGRHVSCTIPRTPLLICHDSYYFRCSPTIELQSVILMSC